MIPPCAVEVMTGIWRVRAEDKLESAAACWDAGAVVAGAFVAVVVDADAKPRRDRGTYGVYVV